MDETWDAHINEAHHFYNGDMPCIYGYVTSLLHIHEYVTSLIHIHGHRFTMETCHVYMDMSHVSSIYMDTDPSMYTWIQIREMPIDMPYVRMSHGTCVTCVSMR